MNFHQVESDNPRLFEKYQSALSSVPSVQNLRRSYHDPPRVRWKTTDYIRRPKIESVSKTPRLLKIPSDFELTRGNRRLSLLEACNKLPPGATSSDIELGGFYRVFGSPAGGSPKIGVFEKEKYVGNNIRSTIIVKNDVYKPSLVKPPQGSGVMLPKPSPLGCIPATSLSDLCSKVRKSWFEKECEKLNCRNSSTNFVPNRMRRRAHHPSLGPSVSNLISSLDLRPFSIPARLDYMVNSEHSRHTLLADMNGNRNNKNLLTEENKEEEEERMKNFFALRSSSLTVDGKFSCLTPMNPSDARLNHEDGLLSFSNVCFKRTQSAPVLYHSASVRDQDDVGLYDSTQIVEEMIQPLNQVEKRSQRKSKSTHVDLSLQVVPIVPPPSIQKNKMFQQNPVDHTITSPENPSAVKLHENYVFEEPQFFSGPLLNHLKNEKQFSLHHRDGRGLPLEWASLKHHESVAFNSAAAFNERECRANLEHVNTPMFDDHRKVLSASCASSNKAFIAVSEQVCKENDKKGDDEEQSDGQSCWNLDSLKSRRAPIHSPEHTLKFTARVIDSWRQVKSLPPVHEASFGVLSASRTASILQKSICTQSNSIENLVEQRKKLLDSSPLVALNIYKPKTSSSSAFSSARATEKHGQQNKKTTHFRPSSNISNAKSRQEIQREEWRLQQQIIFNAEGNSYVENTSHHLCRTELV
eukprot:GDKJ01049098.1.p1 GENE.GDKJ01049098.1~~GDKJ01049098.1.p1  ORF type:complete len:704 (-),score=118.50 GDKJ01049098.1:593-2677(-)